MKKAILGLALASACTCSFATWSQTYTGGNYSGTMTYGLPGGPTRTLVQNEAMDAQGQAKGPIGVFAVAALAVHPQLQASINAWAQSSAASSGTSMAGGVLSGPIQAAITGESGAYAGLNKIVFSGPTYNVSFSASGSKWGISYTCTSNVTLTNLVITAAYDPLTSLLDQSQSSVNFTPSTSSSCSSGLDWLPIVGSAVDRFAAGKTTSATLTQLNAFSGTAIQKVLPAAPQYLGVNSAIPSGVFVFDNNDWGAFIKNNFASVFVGKTLTLTFYPPKIDGHFVAGLSEPQDSYIDSDFAIDFSDATKHLSFSVTSLRQYDNVWHCSKPGVCAQP